MQRLPIDVILNDIMPHLEIKDCHALHRVYPNFLSWEVITPHLSSRYPDLHQLVRTSSNPTPDVYAMIAKIHSHLDRALLRCSYIQVTGWMTTIPTEQHSPLIAQYLDCPTLLEEELHSWTLQITKTVAGKYLLNFQSEKTVVRAALLLDTRDFLVHLITLLMLSPSPIPGPTIFARDLNALRDLFPQPIHEEEILLRRCQRSKQIALSIVICLLLLSTPLGLLLYFLVIK